MGKAQPIKPMHRSMAGSQVWRCTPIGMSSLTVNNDLKHDMTNIALSIFTDCVNAGKTFQDAILAVYLSGLENGVSTRKGTQ